MRIAVAGAVGLCVALIVWFDHRCPRGVNPDLDPCWGTLSALLISGGLGVLAALLVVVIGMTLRGFIESRKAD